MDLNLGLGVGGFVLGLISAWPRLMAWAGSARNVYSSTAHRIAERRARKVQLALHDPCYLVAYIFFNLSLCSGLALAAYAVKLLTLGDGLVAGLLALRLVVSMLAGLFLGNVIGMSLVVMQVKQADAKAGG